MEDQEHKIIVTVLHSVKSKSFTQRTKQTSIVIKVVLLQSTSNQCRKKSQAKLYGPPVSNEYPINDVISPCWGIFQWYYSLLRTSAESNNHQCQRWVEMKYKSFFCEHFICASADSMKRQLRRWVATMRCKGTPQETFSAYTSLSQPSKLYMYA